MFNRLWTSGFWVIHIYIIVQFDQISTTLKDQSICNAAKLNWAINNEKLNSKQMYTHTNLAIFIISFPHSSCIHWILVTVGVIYLSTEMVFSTQMTKNADQWIFCNRFQVWLGNVHPLIKAYEESDVWRISFNYYDTVIHHSDRILYSNKVLSL